MLSKCANPDCSAHFLYLHQGKLFRFETRADGHGASGYDPETKKLARRVEFFWLCDHCAAVMTLTFKEGIGVRAESFALIRKMAS